MSVFEQDSCQVEMRGISALPYSRKGAALPGLFTALVLYSLGASAEVLGAKVKPLLGASVKATDVVDSVPAASRRLIRGGIMEHDLERAILESHHLGGQ